MVPWDELMPAMEEAGIAERTGRHPERWRVRTFPDDAALRAAGIDPADRRYFP